MPVTEDRFSPKVPLPLTPVTGTAQVMPSLLVGVPIRPVPSVPARLKLLAATPLTATLKLTVKRSLAALVNAAPTRAMPVATGWFSTVMFSACVKLLPPASVTWIST